MSKLDLFLKIRKDIRATLSGLLVFSAAIFCGVSWFLLVQRNEQVETLIVRQVDSLAGSRILAQDFLSIQQELSRFVSSLKESLPYNVSVSVNLAGQLVAGDGKVDDALSTRIEKKRKLPSGDLLVVNVELENRRAIAESLGLLFVFILSGYGVYRFLIFRLEKSFDLESRPIVEKLDKALALEHRSEIVEQVAHDIRSPLTALDLAIKEIKITPDEKTLLRKSVMRINDVLDDLTSSGETNLIGVETLPLKKESLSAIIADILSEKESRARSRNVSLKFVSQTPLSSAVNRKELSRVLSNIIDNAFDAIEESGRIEVTLSQDERMAVIAVSDTGRGIAAEKLSEVGTRGATFGKNGGKGLGLFHAKETMRAFGGEFGITSVVGVGTTICLKIPAVKSAPELISEIVLGPNHKLVIIDDDSLIHQVWKLKTSNLALELVTFSSPEEFEQAVTPDLIANSFFVVDYEFKSNPKNGINLITEFELQSRSVLISGRYEQPELALECEYFGIRRFPKASIDQLKISFESVINRTGDSERVRV